MIYMILTVTLNPTIDISYYIPNLVPGNVIRVQEKAEHAGGKGINVAKVAKLLKQNVIATGFLGGSNGDFINSSLIKAGIISSFVMVEEQTRTCISVNDMSNGKQTELLEAGSVATEEMQDRFVDHYCELLEDCEYVVLAGSVPPGIDTSFYPKLIKLAKSANKFVVLDTSDKLLKASIDLCPEDINIIKPNRDELSVCLGRTIKTLEETISAAKEIQRRGIQTVIVSLGKDGAIFVTEDEVYRGTTPDIKIVNTVGCGDSLVAGYVTGIIRKYSFEDRIKLAMAVSTANALSREIGSFKKSDLDDLLNKVTAIKL